MITDWATWLKEERNRVCDPTRNLVAQQRAIMGSRVMPLVLPALPEITYTGMSTGFTVTPVKKKK